MTAYVCSLYVCAGPVKDVQQLLIELREVDDWYTFGAYLGVPVKQLKKIRAEKHDVDRSKVDLFDQWLSITPAASWRTVVFALEMTDYLVLASTVKSRYLVQQVEGEDSC